MSVWKSASAEMPGDQRRHQIRVGRGEVVVAARHDFETGVRDPRFEMPADRDRADGIGVAPDQEGRRGDLLDRQAGDAAIEVIQAAAFGNDLR